MIPRNIKKFLELPLQQKYIVSTLIITPITAFANGVKSVKENFRNKTINPKMSIIQQTVCTIGYFTEGFLIGLFVAGTMWPVLGGVFLYNKYLDYNKKN